jgi:hypothetical protein
MGAPANCGACQRLTSGAQRLALAVAARSWSTSAMRVVLLSSSTII